MSLRRISSPSDLILSPTSKALKKGKRKAEQCESPRPCLYLFAGLRPQENSVASHSGCFSVVFLLFL